MHFHSFEYVKQDMACVLLLLDCSSYRKLSDSDLSINDSWFWTSQDYNLII